jgi:hypothetical protein
MSRFRSFGLFLISNGISTSSKAGIGMVLLLALSGCTSVKVHLGMKVYLAQTPVASIAVSLPKGPGSRPERNRRSWS